VNAVNDPPNLAVFLFSTVFMDTAATIPTGAMAERWKFSAFLVYGVFMSAVLYPLYGNWVWGGGWLSTLGINSGLGHGHVDFAGSTVVHMTGGVTGLAGTFVLGPRLGKYRADGNVAAMPGHNLPLSVLGTLILAFGWFGFNAASTFSATDHRIALIAVNTMLASSAGALGALAYVWTTLHKPDVGMACNGLLGGLVAITASCAFVSPPAAALIGFLAGLLVVAMVHFLEWRLRIDDPVGAIAVHGACGAWGAIALGLFADGTYGAGWNAVPGTVRGLFYGDGGQLVAQLIGVAVNFAFVFTASYAFFRLVDRGMGLRVPQEVELSGLDSLEMGTDAYPRG
jgi:Amt family ammonium transporter